MAFNVPFVGTAALGVATTASILAAQPAAAALLDFDFKFSGSSFPEGSAGSVEGIISGLADDTPNQTTGFSVEVTSSTLGSLGPYSYLDGIGLSVSGGRVVGRANWFGTSGDSILNLRQFDPQGLISTHAVECSPIPFGFECNKDIRGLPTFTPRKPASAPGPLPLLGAAAAFGYSRKLRKRIKSSKLLVASAID